MVVVRHSSTVVYGQPGRHAVVTAETDEQRERRLYRACGVLVHWRPVRTLHGSAVVPAELGQPNCVVGPRGRRVHVYLLRTLSVFLLWLNRK